MSLFVLWYAASDYTFDIFVFGYVNDNNKITNKISRK